MITGGCGFIGSHLVQHIYKNTNWEIVIIDKLSYASKGFTRIKELNFYGDPRILILTWDLVNPLTDGMRREIGVVNYIIHMAAATHVDYSIENPVMGIQNNVLSTISLLEFARTLSDLRQFFYFSTDEVFGPALESTLYKEWDRHRPTNPYSASKSAAEQICISYENTYKTPVIIVNVMNAFGQRQHVEKFIPLVINKLLKNETIHIHSYPDGVKSGSRFYIHCRNISDAVLFLINNGTIGEKYNITGEREVSNLELATTIAKIVGKPLHYEMVSFHSLRPGHDLRYGLDGTKLFEMGWRPPVDFEKSLEDTVSWYLNNPNWLEM